MGFVNKVMLMGNTTRDPELRQLPTGTALCEFTLAVNRVYKTASGEEKQEAAFVDCTAFNRTAEVIHEYCSKGKPLFVEGRLHYETWDDKNGNKRNKLSVVVENFQFVGSRESAGAVGAGVSPMHRELPENSGVRKSEPGQQGSVRRGSEQFEQGQRPERAFRKRGKVRTTETVSQAVDKMADEAGNVEDADLPF